MQRSVKKQLWQDRRCQSVDCRIDQERLPNPPPGGSIMSSHEQSSTSRRDFLHQAAGLAAGLGAAAPALAAADAPTKTDVLLPTVKLGPHSITRLIIGGNPIYGY